MTPATTIQRSFDDLGTPLSDVEFCVVDVETTGGPADSGAITEIGAVRARGGVENGTLRTFVNPGQAIPRRISILTGITDAMVAPAPRIDAVLPHFLEFLGSAVLVGHNVGYDLAHLNSALAAHGWEPLSNQTVDTLPLARRLLGGEVPNHKLGTLADRLGLARRPSHRALDDALATLDLLHLLLERAGSLGVTGLHDLSQLPNLANHPEAGKLKLTDRLPRRPGVYLFRNRKGEVLYVGRAKDLKTRVRSYFSSDRRRKVGRLLSELHSIDHIVCHSHLEAAVREIRLIHRHTPRYNRQHTRVDSYRYVGLTNEAFPRLSVVATNRPGVLLGPLSSTRSARAVVDALERCSPVRRCLERVPASAPEAAPSRPPCLPAQLGVAACPCSGTVSVAEYGEITRALVDGCGGSPDLLTDPLEWRLVELASSQRFEEAAGARDALTALTGAIRRRRRAETVRRCGVLIVEDLGGTRLEIRDGRVRTVYPTAVADQARLPIGESMDETRAIQERLSLRPEEWSAPATSEIDELLLIESWMRRGSLRLVAVEGVLASDWPGVAPPTALADRSAA